MRMYPPKMLHLTDIAVILRESTVECLKRYHKAGPISPVMKPWACAEQVVQTFSIIFAAMWFTTRSSCRRKAENEEEVKRVLLSVENRHVTFS